MQKAIWGRYICPDKKECLSMLPNVVILNPEIRFQRILPKTELGVIAAIRNKELDDLHVQQKKWLADMDYLATNKLTLLRTNTMDISAIQDEESRISLKLAEIEVKMRAQTESAEAILDYVISFSELVKNAALYYKHALDTEKQEIAANMFSELVFDGRKLVNYKAKEGFEALLNRKIDHDRSSGARGGS